MRQVTLLHTTSAFGAERSRSTRTTDDAIIFQRNSKVFINRMMKQWGKTSRLSATISNKLFGCYFDVFQKYNNSSLEFIESLSDWYDNVILHNLIT